MMLGLFNVLIKNEETSIIGNPTVFDMCVLFFMRRQVGLIKEIVQPPWFDVYMTGIVHGVGLNMRPR